MDTAGQFRCVNIRRWEGLDRFLKLDLKGRLLIVFKVRVVCLGYKSGIKRAKNWKVSWLYIDLNIYLLERNNESNLRIFLRRRPTVWLDKADQMRLICFQSCYDCIEPFDELAIWNQSIVYLCNWPIEIKYVTRTTYEQMRLACILAANMGSKHRKREK